MLRGRWEPSLERWVPLMRREFREEQVWIEVKRAVVEGEEYKALGVEELTRSE